MHVARELDLVFPSALATAMTIRSMHQALEGVDMARRKMRALVIAFSSALLLRVVSQYAIGVFWVRPILADALPIRGFRLKCPIGLAYLYLVDQQWNIG